MIQIYPKLITDALATVRYPGTGKNLIEAEMMEDDLRIDGMHVSFSLIFEKSTDPFMKSVIKAAETAIHTYVDKDVQVEIKTKTLQAARPEPGKMLPQVKNVIAVSSGKGGVGKSTVAANLAVALAKQGYKVGLLDADIFGPSVPKMFHMEAERIFAEMKDGRQLLIPALKYGVKVLSIGFFVNPDTATLWRGGMASNALKQLIADADWGELDYFVLDTPPGTSDIHLTLLQNLAITGAIKDAVVDIEEIAVVLCARLRALYPELLSARYKLGDPAEYAELTDYELFELIGRKRGFLISGGEINAERTANMLLDELRAAKIGRITLDGIFIKNQSEETDNA